MNKKVLLMFFFIVVLLFSYNNTYADKSSGDYTEEWVCPACGNNASKNFCNNCGAARPVENDSGFISDMDNIESTDDHYSQDVKNYGKLLYVTKKDGTAKIVGIDGRISDLEIPDSIEGYSVTVIGENAFSGTSISSITIPGTVTVIEDDAFYNCGRLSEIRFVKGLVQIGKCAFCWCENLYSIAIPDTVEIIEEEAFYGCKLWEITLGNCLKEIGDRAFGLNEIQSITLPRSVIKIGVNPFSDCERLSKINVYPDQDYLAVINETLYSKPDKRLICYPMDYYTWGEFVIPDGIEIIGAEAFYRCKRYLEIDLPDSVTTIEDDAFSYSDIRKICISRNVKKIGANPFNNMDHPKIIISAYNQNIVEENGSIYDRKNKKVIHGYVIPNGAEIIGAKLYYYQWNCSEEIILPDTITTIEHEAFYGCNALRLLTIPSSVIYIGDMALDNCSLLSCIVDRGSYAEQYCKDNNIPYQYPDNLSTDWLK